MGLTSSCTRASSLRSSSLYNLPSRVPITLAFSMLESLDQDSTSPSTKAILFPLSSRKDIDVTSRSGALSELILWGHLLASDTDYYTIGNLIVIMRQYGYDDMLFCCIDIDVFYWLVSPECIGFCTSKMHKNRWNPWTPNRVKEWTIGVWLLYIWQIYIWLDVMIMDFIFDMICWWCRLSIACRLDSHVE